MTNPANTKQLKEGMPKIEGLDKDFNSTPPGLILLELLGRPFEAFQGAQVTALKGESPFKGIKEGLQGQQFTGREIIKAALDRALGEEKANSIYDWSAKKAQDIKTERAKYPLIETVAKYDPGRKLVGMFGGGDPDDIFTGLGAGVEIFDDPATVTAAATKGAKLLKAGAKAVKNSGVGQEIVEQASRLAREEGGFVGKKPTKLEKTPYRTLLEKAQEQNPEISLDDLKFAAKELGDQLSTVEGKGKGAFAARDSGRKLKQYFETGTEVGPKGGTAAFDTFGDQIIDRALEIKHLENTQPFADDWKNFKESHSGVKAGALEVGEKIETPVDTYKVVSKEGDYVTLKDGTEFTVNADTDVPAVKFLGGETPEIRESFSPKKIPEIGEDVKTPIIDFAKNHVDENGNWTLPGDTLNKELGLRTNDEIIDVMRWSRQQSPHVKRNVEGSGSAILRQRGVHVDEIKWQGENLKLKEDVAEPVKSGSKERKFITTVRDSQRTSPEVSSKIQGDYDPISNKITSTAAKNLINKDIDEAIKRAKDPNDVSAESTAIAMHLIDDYQRAGRFEDAIDMVESTAAKLTKQGQSIQAASIYNRLTPTGVLKMAEKTYRGTQTPEVVKAVTTKAQEVADDINKITGAGVAEVEKEIRYIKGGTEQTLKGATKAEVTPGEMLAKKVLSYEKKYLKGPKTKGPDPVREMVDTLYSFTKERLPKEARKVSDKNPIQSVADALANKDDFRETFTKAKEIVAEKFKDNPKALEDLENFFNISASKGFAKSQLSNGVQKAIRESEVDLEQLVRKHYSEVDKTKKTLVDKIVGEMNVSQEVGEELANFIKYRIDEVTREKKLQILNRLSKEKNPAIKKNIADQMLELSNLGALDSSDFYKIVAKKTGLPTLTPELAKELKEMAENIQKMPSGREKQIATQLMLKRIADEIPSSTGQKLTTLQTMAQLLNPKTIIRNIVGNLGFQGVESVSDALAVPIDRALSKLTGVRTKTGTHAGQQVKGLIKGAKEGAEEALAGVNTLGNKTQFDLPTGSVFKSKLMQSGEKALGLALRAPDRAFYQAAFDASISNQMEAAAKTGKAVEAPTEEMLKIAHEDGLYRTFQDDNFISEVFTGLKRVLNKIPILGKDFGAGEILLKYPKTPANLLARGIDYSPAGFVHALFEASKPLRGQTFNQKKFVESFSRAIVGTATVGMGYTLYKLGIITGKPEDDKDAAAFQRDEGLGGYKINGSALKRYVESGFDPEAAKIKRGDTLVSYDWFQPHAIPLSMGANMAQTQGRGIGAAAELSDQVSTMGEGLASGVNTLSEQPLVQGLTRFMKQKDAAGSLVATGESIPSSFVPTIFNQVRMLTDKTRRNTYDPNKLKETLNLVKLRVPGLSQTLEPRIGAFGQESENFDKDSGTFEKVFDAFINPAWVTKYNPTPESEMVLNLFSDTGETKHIPPVIGKKSTLEGVKLELTPEQRTEMQRFVGSLAQKYFSELAKDEKFLSSTPEQQVDILSNRLTEIGKIAKVKVLGDDFLQSTKDPLSQALIKQEKTNLKIYEKAEILFDTLKSLPPEERKPYLDEYVKSDDPYKKLVLEEYKDVFSDRGSKLTYDERRIKRLGVSTWTRARYIHNKIQGMSEKEKNAYLYNLNQKKILDDTVYQQIKALDATNK